MSDRVIVKSAITDVLEKLLKARRVFAPVQRDGLLRFEPLRTGDEPLLDSHNSKRPLKEIFFPHSETLFAYEEGEVAIMPLPEEQRVIFGVRPCDARSLLLLDKVFNAPDVQDPYYVTRRENTILIGLGCNRPLSTCFCTTLGRGPFTTEGLDLLFTDLGDRYLVETVTERGEALVADSPYFREAAPADVNLKAEIAARAEQTISGPSVEGIKEKLDGMYEDPFWDELHQKCLGCAVCTYLCPTCHCFDILDEKEGSRGRRVRIWDSCQFPLFTLHASGHNPRPSGRERMRQRIMHKFHYFVENYGQIACVGCGRCIRNCPVNMDLREVLNRIVVKRGA